MAKNTSLFGKVSGKLGAVVFSTSGGQTISREYNPHVSNPSTDAQVNQRARMKLMSQISAIMSPVIAMQKEGLVSKRNKFVKRNFENSIAQEGFAQVSYENLQLTEGNSALPQIVGWTSSNSANLKAALEYMPSPAITRVVWCVFRKQANGALELVYTYISNVREEEAYTGYAFGMTLPTEIAEKTDHPYDLVFYAYGMADTSERATAQYGNMNVRNAQDIATLIANRTINFSDYSFTQTRGATWYAGQDEIEEVDPNKVRLSLTALAANGTVSGAGSYDIGTSVTASATPAQGYEFVEWRINGTSQVVSSANPYTFNINEDTDLIAIFGPRGGL